ncbi:MAG: DUF3866 family protein [Acidimicrobiales bacterium]
MPRFETRTVAAVLLERPGLQRIELDGCGARAYVLTDLIGPVAEGDRVVVNTTAVDLGLGTGGWHVVHWNLSREGWSAPGGGHVLKLRYTSLQADTGVAEESGPPAVEDLGGRPVVVCDLHSQVACVAAGFSAAAPGRRLVFVMTDSAALPLALSDVVAELRAGGRLAATVTCGQAFGGDVEAVNTVSGMLLAAAHGDALVVGPGPGVVGTGTRFGFSGLEAVAVIDGAARRGGRPILCVRWSEADTRPHHRGLSHHTATVLADAGETALVAVPRGGSLDGVARHLSVEVDVPGGLDVGDVATMGRGRAEDPAFFVWSAAAGVLAGQLVGVTG